MVTLRSSKRRTTAHNNSSNGRASSSRPTGAFESLPDVIATIIMEFLTPVDCAKSSAVCKVFHAAASSPELWRAQLLRADASMKSVVSVMEAQLDRGEAVVSFKSLFKKAWLGTQQSDARKTRKQRKDERAFRGIFLRVQVLQGGADSVLTSAVLNLDDDETADKLFAWDLMYRGAKVKLQDGMQPDDLLGCDVVVTLLDLRRGRVAQLMALRDLCWDDEGYDETEGDREWLELGHRRMESEMTIRGGMYASLEMRPVLVAEWTWAEDELQESGDSDGETRRATGLSVNFHVNFLEWLCSCGCQSELLEFGGVTGRKRFMDICKQIDTWY